LVVAGRFSFIVAIATLTICRLKRFDHTLEEAALQSKNHTRRRVGTVTHLYLNPALIGAAANRLSCRSRTSHDALMLVGSVRS
jgi:spermidine/putrescine transport system permease protein